MRLDPHTGLGPDSQLFRERLTQQLQTRWSRRELNSLNLFTSTKDSQEVREVLKGPLQSIGSWSDNFDPGSRERTLVHRAWQSPESLSSDEVLQVRDLLLNRKVSPFAKLLNDVRLSQEVVRPARATGNLNVTKFTTSSVAERYGVDARLLEPGVLAYDIETDTSEHLGLRPLSTVITDVSVATAGWCWTLSGDERMILTVFRELLEDYSDSVRVGWNNHSFDDVTIQTRAQVTDVEGWDLTLRPTVNYSPFVPVSVSLQNVGLTDGDSCTKDVFQVRARGSVIEGRRDFVGLKDYSLSRGRSPRREDAARLHQLNVYRRSRYCLSDALMTFAAFVDIPKG